MKNWHWNFTAGKVSVKAYHAKMYCEFHSNTHREYQSDCWDSAEFDANKTKETKQLNRSHC